MDLSIILPTYNERDNILKLVNNIEDLFTNLSYEIIIVDDNSPDGTYKFCEQNF